MKKRHVILIIVITLFLTLIISGLCLYLFVKPVLTINGEEEIILSLNETYNEDGAILTIFKKD